MIKQCLPNMITISNLLCGCMGIIHIDNLYLASLFIIFGAVFDFFDGFVARLLSVSTKIGKQLDSFADMVTFGVLPSLIVYNLLEQQFKSFEYVKYLALIIAACSSIRLAIFNLSTNQTKQFMGLATTTLGLFISVYTINIFKTNYIELKSLLTSQPLLIMLPFLSILLISSIPYLAFKFEGYSFSANKIKYFYILLLLISLFFKWEGILFFFAFYILQHVLTWFFKIL